MSARYLRTERGRTIAAAENHRDTSIRRNRRTAFNRRYREIQFGAGPFTSQRNAYRVKERLAFHPRPLFDPIGHGAECVAIDERRLDGFGEHGDHFTRAVFVQHSRDFLARERRRRIVVKQKLQTIGNLLQPID